MYAAFLAALLALCPGTLWCIEIAGAAQIDQPSRARVDRRPDADVRSEDAADTPTTPVRAQRPTALSAMAAFGSAVVTALLLLLYGYRRQPYIMLWVLSWSLMADSLTVMSVDFDSRALDLSMLGFSQFLGIAAALLLVLSADTYRRRTLPGPRYLLGLLPLLIWFTLAPIGLGSQSVIVPGYLISAGLLATGGLAYLAVLRGARFLGAGLIGIMLLLLSCTYAWIAISVYRSDSTAQIPVQLMVLNALLYVFAALGMHLLVFEHMTYELRVINRQLKGAQTELHKLVITDPLTGCHNRRFFDEVIGRELQRHRRSHILLSLLFVDIDRFKTVNGSLGHEAGDRVLQDVVGVPQVQRAGSRLRVPLGQRRVPGVDFL